MINIHTIPINIGDFMKDTLHMDTREVGAYILLFIAHIQSGEDGLPYDPKRLARIAKVSDKVWKNTLSIHILEHFHMIPHPTGNPNLIRLVNDRCLEVIRQVESRSEQNRRNANKRWKNDNTIDFRSHNDRNPK